MRPKDFLRIFTTQCFLVSVHARLFQSLDNKLGKWTPPLQTYVDRIYQAHSPSITAPPQHPHVDLRLEVRDEPPGNDTCGYLGGDPSKFLQRVTMRGSETALAGTNQDQTLKLPL
jgi:hypothetical protein